MKIFKLTSDDNHVIRGLLSEKSNNSVIIIHFHGFGGDCFANHFLQVMHEELPKKGISFLSVNTRYSGYLVEDYTENGVVYTGASVSDFENFERDIDVLLSFFSNKYKICILQGHSFGTNLVKLYLRKKSTNLLAIFLSPADSVELYKSWQKNKKTIMYSEKMYSGYIIRTDNFGMLTDYGEYQIPMTDKSLKKLLTSEIFNEWSLPMKKLYNKALVIKGSKDTISNHGTIATSETIYSILPNSKQYTIDNAKHIFSNHEYELLEIIEKWVNDQIK